MEIAPSDPGPDSTTASDGPEAGTSLADHEAQYSPGTPAAPTPGTDDEPPPDAAADRDDAGRFRTGRHRAKSQDAGPEDVATISALTKRIKDAEAAAGADIAQQPGESNRVYELRRRAELAERRASLSPPAPARVAPPTPPRTEARPPVAADFTTPKPTLQSFIDALKPDEDYHLAQERYQDARDEWNDAKREHQRQQREAATARDAAAQSYKQSLEQRRQASAAKHPDFEACLRDAPLAAKIGQDSLIDRWVLQHKHGFELLYHLHKTPADLDRLQALSDEDQALEIPVLVQRLITPPAPAKIAAVPGPRPLAPVRTGPVKTVDETPDDDDMSLSAHEKHYAPRHR